MRRLPLLVLAPAVFLGTALSATPASAAPLPATGLRQFAAIGGVGLTWTASPDPVTGYHIYRSGLPLTDVTDLSTPLTYIDSTLDAGASANYTVIAYDDNGATPTGTLPVTRPAADATIGTGKALALEAAGQHYFMDAARAGDDVTLPADVLTGAVSGTTHGTATLPLVAGPGTYSSDTTPVDLTVDGTSCPFTGSTHVIEAAFDADLHPLTYAADLTGTCSGSPVRASLRWASDVPYVAVNLSSDTFAFGEHDLTTTTPATLTLTNKGLAPLALGTFGLTGAQAADYTAGAGTCTSSLDPDASCDMSLGFTPSAYGERDAQLDLTLGAENRSVLLSGIGGHLPGVVQNVVVTKTYHRNLVTWSAPSNLGSPAATTYRVYRNHAANPSVSVVIAGTSFLDTTPGDASQYRIVAFNPAGDGPAYDVDAAPNATSAVLETSTGPGVDAGLYMVADSPSQQSVLVPFLADATPRYGAAVSPDGNRVVYSQVNGSNSDLYIANLDGTGTPLHLTSLAGDEEDASWSPDGKAIAFTYYTDTTIDVRTVAATGGTPVRRIANYEHPSWLADSTRLVADDFDNEGLAIVDAAGKATPIAGSESGFYGTVSPDGKTVAFIFDDFDNGQLRLATLPISGGTLNALSDTGYWWDLSWTPDGTRILGERSANFNPPTRSASVGVNGTTFSDPTILTTASPEGRPVLVRSKVHLTSFSAITGANATIGFASTDPSVTCSFDGAAATPCTTSYAKTGLTAGKHGLVIRSYSAPGGTLLSMTAAEFTVDRSAPTIAITSPTSNTAGLTTTASFGYRGTDTGAGVLNYDVRYRRAPSNGAYGAYISPSGWLGTTATSRAITASPGNEYCFSVRARDRVGNVSVWTTDRCVDIALDDRNLTASAGWTRVAAGGNYKSTLTQTTKTGTSLSRTVQARRVTLVVTRCAKCGQVYVYLAGVRIGTVNTYASTTQRQVRIALPLQGGVRSGSLVLKPVTAGKYVIIDGVATGRA